MLGAAFLMATSAIGPGFLTQTATFTSSLGPSFGFVVLISLIMAGIAQMNIWRVLCYTGKRGQDVANEVIGGLGFVLAGLIALGGLAFNMGNVGGGGLGLDVLFGMNVKIGYILTALAAIVLFLSKRAKSLIDEVVKYLGAIMIVVILIVMVITKPPVGDAVVNTFVPSKGIPATVPAILTLLGGTVGGYITFSGAHRLIDAGVTGEDHLEQAQRSSVMGIGIAAIVRVLLFLAILGVVTKYAGINLADPSANTGIAGVPEYNGINNPAAYAFLVGAGNLAYRFAGLVILCASVTSVIGAAYTSVSFLKTFHHSIEENENKWIIGFIAFSSLVMTIFGNSKGAAAKLLVLAGALNGIILPLSLACILLACRNKKIVGDKYEHPAILFYLGWIVVAISGYIAITTLPNLANLFK
jgi:Mn2+/Fe2+ NRAMP family transporter